MPDIPNPQEPKRDTAEPAPKQEENRCLRCRQAVPVDEDGFCERCLREIDQACL